MVIAELSRVSESLAQNQSLLSMESVTQAPTGQFFDYIVRTGPTWICIVLTITVGIPVYFATKYETPFEALCFILFWVLAVQFQRSLKRSCRLLQHPRLASTLVILANPVLITWGLGTAYLWIKMACTGHTIASVVVAFRRHNNLPEGIIAVAGGGGLASHIGAGDLAGPVLDAGIVCLGFKMFEYRSELWESFVTVVTTCALLAVANVFLNVIVAHALGLKAEDAIAFAARSVTIALGAPAVQNLGGSTTLMSAMVIFSGIIFQMAGDWLFYVLRINDRDDCRARGSTKSQDSSSSSSIDKEKEKEKSAAPLLADEEKEARRNGGSDNSVLVSAGVTVGINAAAMGTAHLIERNSRATAYSALSMTVFGAMTVALTAIPGVSEAIITLASR